MVQLPWSNQVSNRFTPPTCSLEVSARRSALSQWSDRPVWKHVRFQLRFDDPRLSEDEHVVVQGDRRQLEALIQLVNDYVSNQLGADATVPSFVALLGQTEANVNGGNGDASPAPVAIAASPAANLAPASNAATPAPVPTFGLTLRPQGFLAHQLCLGQLTSSQPQVSLSTTQLFDLATALDDYQAAGLAVPTLAAGRSRSLQRWGAIAASVLLTVAVAPTVYRRISGPATETAQITAESDLAESSPRAGTEFDPNAPRAIDREALANQPLPPDPSALDSFPLAEPSPPPPDPNAPPADPAAGAVPAPTAVPNPAPNPAEPNADSNTVTLPGAPIAPAPIPNAPTRSPSTNSQALGDTAPAAEAEMDDFSAPAPQAAARSSTRSAEVESFRAPAPPAPTLFDTQPQIVEARSYLQQRWSPPNDLTQTLEYRVTVGADGQVQFVRPLGNASATYQAQTGLPAAGSAFVSPLAEGDSLNMRIVLSPNGTVRTFAE